jgi:protein-tyrosine phosphatase
MDSANLAELERLASSAGALAKLRLLSSFDPAAAPGAPIPDPYYGDDTGFDRVLELCRSACRHLLQEIREEHGW